MPYKPFTKINKNVVDEVGIRLVVRVLKSGLLSRPEGGKYVNLFQNKLASLINKKYAFATSSGTSSLHGALVSLGLNNDDEVLVPAITFAADASTVVQAGAKPIFVDIDRDDFNINPEDVERKIGQKTRAIIIVHMFGQPAKMDQLLTIARKNKLAVIEDCAQAIGAKYKGQQVGSFGDISCFSFYQTKHVVCGEGGLIAVNDDRQAEILRSVLNNGIKRENLDEYDFDHIGFNYQMTEMQAALGLRQLQRLDGLNKIRREYSVLYQRLLQKTEIVFQKEICDSYSVYCYLTGLLPENMAHRRNEFIFRLHEYGVPIKKQYPLALPETEIFQKLGYGIPRLTPVAVKLARRFVNFNVNPGLTKRDIYNFSHLINKIYREMVNEK